MIARTLCLFLAGALACTGLLSGAADAAIKVRRPVLVTDPEPKSESKAKVLQRSARSRDEARTYYVGNVIFSRGDQLVAEIPDGARERERLVVFDAEFRRRGTVIVLKPLEGGVYLLQTLGSLTARPGDRLALESEGEAVVRVLRENRAEGYREFVELFPRSKHRPRMAREMFRLAMKQSYPTFPGTVVEGQVRVTETVGRSLSVGQVLVVLDRYIIARTDDAGVFRIEGLPKLEQPVQLKLRVKDDKFRAAEVTMVELPGGAYGEVTVEIPLRITPTALVGQVVDDHGTPLHGVEVWTAPYTMEAFTDDTGSYRISRIKRLGATGALGDGDEPLFGDDYEVFAYRKGYSVNRSLVSAESFQENSVPSIRLLRQDLRRQRVPELGLELHSYLEIDAAVASQEGPTPKLNP